MGRAWRSSSRASTRSPEAGLAISSTAITRPFRIWIPGSGCVCAAFCVSVRSGAVGAEGAIINAGPMLSLPRRGCSLLHKPMRRCVNPLGGEPLTGEPDAGNPPVRFGGRGSETNRLSLPPIQVGIGAQNNMIGGTATGAGNVISGNGSGVAVTGGSGTSIVGNIIGLNVSGIARVGFFGNDLAGVLISGGSATVGGTAPGARNVISGNGGHNVSAVRPAQILADGVGIIISGGTGSQVIGNLIGPDAAGTGTIANDSGVRIDGVANNVIGGTSSAARNIISGNEFGVGITGIGATNNVVQGNLITGNGEGGVGISGGATNNKIGGTVPGAGNTI